MIEPLVQFLVFFIVVLLWINGVLMRRLAAATAEPRQLPIDRRDHSPGWCLRAAATRRGIEHLNGIIVRRVT